MSIQDTDMMYGVGTTTAYKRAGMRYRVGTTTARLSVYQYRALVHYTCM